MPNLQKWQPRRANSGDEAWGIIVDGTRAKPEWIILPTKKLSGPDVGLMCEAHNAAIEVRPERSIFASSIVNQNLEPRVVITMGPEVAQLDIREARQHVSQLQEAIEAAMSDALLCRFIKDHVYGGRDDEASQRAMGSLLEMFREFRHEVEDPTVEASDKPA